MQLLDQGHILAQGKIITQASLKVKSADIFTVKEPPAEPLDLVPLHMDLDIIFEDAHLIVINKPAGLTVHPAAGNRNTTLVNALLAHCGSSLSGIGGVARPGIVHRIDKDTSGLLVVAKTDAAHQHLAVQLKSRDLKRHYIAYAWNKPPSTQGLVDAPIARNPKNRKEMAIVADGRHAITHYRVEASYRATQASAEQWIDPSMPTPTPLRSATMRNKTPYVNYAVKLHCELDTGRTHQIRVHMAHLGCPLIGDQVYGLSIGATLRRFYLSHKDDIPDILAPITLLKRQALHAESLRFFHPETGEKLEFHAPLPPDLLALQTTLSSLTNQRF